MMESLMEDSLMEEEDMQSFRAVGDKNHRQANFSTSVILTRGSKEGEYSDGNERKNNRGDAAFQTHLYLLCMMA